MSVFFKWHAILAYLLVSISAAAQTTATSNMRLVHDSIIWTLATDFTSRFNSRDTAGMRTHLPEGFMLQWMHENCMGKKALLKTMCDTAVHASFRHTLSGNSQTIINYSDDGRSATVNATVVFLDNRLKQLMTKENGYGLCIMYFEMEGSAWVLKTVHLDMHCTLCNL